METFHIWAPSGSSAPRSSLHASHSLCICRCLSQVGTFRLLGAELRPPSDEPAVHAASAIARRCEELLETWPSSLEDDLAAIGAVAAADVNAALATAAGEDAASRGRSGRRCAAPALDGEVVPEAALRYRAGKKIVLRAALRWLRSRWPIGQPGAD